MGAAPTCMPLLPEVKIFMIGGEIDCQHSGQRGFGLGKGRGAWESGRTWMRLVGSMGSTHEYRYTNLTNHRAVDDAEHQI